MPKESTSFAPARLRVGLPIVADGSADRPLLLRLPDADADERGACNNGCRVCLTEPITGQESDFSVDVSGRHVVIRHREATLRPDLARLVSDLRARGAKHVSLVTNGRLLLYAPVAERLMRAGVDRFVVKLFGASATVHDRHVREPGSFDQARAGIASLRELAADVLVTFPAAPDVPESEVEAARGAQRNLARALTGRDPVEMPEPQVASHANEYRYDVVLLRDPPLHRLWQSSFFPMVHVNTGPVCNIRCVYCNVHGGDDQRLFERAYVEKLVTDSAEYVRDASRPHGLPTIDFIGGAHSCQESQTVFGFDLLKLGHDRCFDRFTLPVEMAQRPVGPLPLRRRPFARIALRIKPPFQRFRKQLLQGQAGLNRSGLCAPKKRIRQLDRGFHRAPIFPYSAPCANNHAKNRPVRRNLVVLWSCCLVVPPATPTCHAGA